MSFSDSIDVSAAESVKRIRTHYTDSPFKLIQLSSTSSSFLEPAMSASMDAFSLNTSDPSNSLYSDSSSFQRLGRRSSVQKLDGVRAPIVDLDDNFIESMLVGLKENKKILIPSFNNLSHALSNPIPIPSRARHHDMPFDSAPSSPTQEDPELSSSTSSLRSSPIPIQEIAYMSISGSLASSTSFGSSASSSPFVLQDKTRDTRWKEHFLELIEFRRDHGHTNVTQTKSKTLAEWVKNQRRLRKAGKLAQSRITKLDEIGFEWDRSYLFKNKRDGTSHTSSSASSSLNSSSPKDQEHSTSNSRKRKPTTIYDPSSDGDLDYDS